MYHFLIQVIFSVDRHRVDNTESVNKYYLKHSNILYSGIHANDLHVCLWLHVKVIRVNAGLRKRV